MISYPNIFLLKNYNIITTIITLNQRQQLPIIITSIPVMNRNDADTSNDKTMVFFSPTDNTMVQNFVKSFQSPYDHCTDDDGNEK